MFLVVAPSFYRQMYLAGSGFFFEFFLGVAIEAKSAEFVVRFLDAATVGKSVPVT